MFELGTWTIRSWARTECHTISFQRQKWHQTELCTSSDTTFWHSSSWTFICSMNHFVPSVAFKIIPKEVSNGCWRISKGHKLVSGNNIRNKIDQKGGMKYSARKWCVFLLICEYNGVMQIRPLSPNLKKSPIPYGLWMVPFKSLPGILVCPSFPGKSTWLYYTLLSCWKWPCRVK